MKKLIIQLNQIFWKLQILSELPKELRKRERRFILQCHCWTQIQADLNHLQAWKIISCWCEHKKIISKLKTTHWLSKTKEYRKQFYKKWQYKYEKRFIETWSWLESLPDLCRKYNKPYSKIYRYRFYFNKSDKETMIKLQS